MMLSRHGGPRCVLLARSLLALSALLGCAVPAAADPRLVRVIWDVGQQAVYSKAYARAERGHDRFAVPPSAYAALEDGFGKHTGADVLRKGDRVRIYVVNYNPVSHVWHESSVVEQVVEGQSLVGPLLNAVLLAITGAAKFPSTTLVPFAVGVTTPDATSSCPGLPDVRKAVEELRKTCAPQKFRPRSLISAKDQAATESILYS